MRAVEHAIGGPLVEKPKNKHAQAPEQARGVEGWAGACGKSDGQEAIGDRQEGGCGAVGSAEEVTRPSAA